MKCSYCGADNAVKNGKRQRGGQLRCQECGKFSRPDGRMGGLYYPPDVIGAGISLYYEGLPYREAAETLGKKIQSSIYPKTIRDWVHQFSAEGFPEIPGPQTRCGHHWSIYCRRSLDKSLECWLVMDDETRYIIGRTVSIRTSESEASIEEVMRQAKGHLDRQSYSISTRFIPLGSRKMPKAKRDHLDKEIRRCLEWSASMYPLPGRQVPPYFGAQDGPSLAKGLIRLTAANHLMAARLLLDGWALNYNFFVVHRDMGERTPAQVAGMTCPYADWADLVKQALTG